MQSFKQKTYDRGDDNYDVYANVCVMMILFYCDVVSGVVLRHWLPVCHVVIGWQCGNNCSFFAWPDRSAWMTDWFTVLTAEPTIARLMTTVRNQKCTLEAQNQPQVEGHLNVTRVVCEIWCIKGFFCFKRAKRGWCTVSLITALVLTIKPKFDAFYNAVYPLMNYVTTMIIVIKHAVVG